MSNILHDNKITSPSSPSKDLLLQIAGNSILDLSKRSFNNIVNTQRQGIDAVWNHPTLTPQEIIDWLGDKALPIFQFHGELTSFILTIAALANIEVDLKYPTNAFTVDSETGKITVSTDPYVP